MPYTITYISWSLGNGYQPVTQSFGSKTNTTIQALSGTINIVANDLTGSYSETGQSYHSPTASYTFRITKNGPVNTIYTNTFTLNKTSSIVNISNQTTLQSAIINDKFYFELLRNNIEYSTNTGDIMKVYRTPIGTASLALTNTYVNVTTGSNGSFITNLSNNMISLTSSLLTYFNADVNYVPTSSLLYPVFGDIYDSFALNPYDLLITKTIEGTRTYEITSIYTGSGQIDLTIFPPFTSETIGNINYIVLLKRKNDETNIILNFKKNDINTSYGFIIPNNLHPDVLKNIDIITKEVKTKLGLGS